MNSGSAASIDGGLYPNWLPTGVWQGLFSGGYVSYVGGLYNQGGYGYSWSSTAYDTDYAYYLAFYDGLVAPGSNVDKFGGYAVRCAI